MGRVYAASIERQCCHLSLENFYMFFKENNREILFCFPKETVELYLVQRNLVHRGSTYSENNDSNVTGQFSRTKDFLYNVSS